LPQARVEVALIGVTVQWSRVGIGALAGFLVGWYIFGLFGATLLAIAVMLLTGIMKVK
jgi:hypothetical protein